MVTYIWIIPVIAIITMCLFWLMELGYRKSKEKLGMLGNRFRKKNQE